MNKYVKNILFGFVAWLVPFVAAFPFYDSNGLTIDIFLFKSIMVVVGSVTAAILLVLYFKKIRANYLREGILVGLVWFAVNILLDLLILLPISGMTVPDYFGQIGLRYLSIPAMTVAVGASLADKG